MRQAERLCFCPLSEAFALCERLLPSMLSMPHSDAALLQAMGLKPKSLKPNKKPKLDQQDMAKLLGRTESEEFGQPDPLQDPDAVKGLGYAP